MFYALRRATALLIATAALTACGDVDGPDSSYADDPSIFGAAAKADGLALEEGSPEAVAILRVANELSLADLDDVVKLDARAARNIVDAREANGPFATLRALDDVKYVGVNAIGLMRGYADAQGWIGHCGDGIVSGNERCDGGPDCDETCGVGGGLDLGPVVHGVASHSYEALGILAAANDFDLEVLDGEAKLDARAARGIVAARPIADLEALDAVSYVGATAFQHLLDFARSKDLVPSCGDGELNAGLETCDDGNLLAGDGCSALCALEGLDPGDGAYVNGVREGSDQAIAILHVANNAGLSLLDDDIALDARAARGIVEARKANGRFLDLATLDAVPYVSSAAFSRMLGYYLANGAISACGNDLIDDGEACDDGNALANDGCDAACQLEGPPADAVIFDGPEQCSGESQGATRYTYSVISNPPRATTDARVQLRFNSHSPYSPTAQQLQLEVGPDQWVTVFTTMPALPGWQAQTAFVPAATLNGAIDAMGWLRFRVNPGTYYTACSDLDVTYNCPECFACPAGQEDVGFGCQAIDAPFTQTLLDHPTGMCSRSSATLDFISAPVPASDGRLRLEYLPCDGGRIAVAINTANAGWVDVGTDTTNLSCGFKTANFVVPEAYLDAARGEDGTIQVRYTINDSCRPGMGCASYNDPCVRRVNLQFEQ